MEEIHPNDQSNAIMTELIDQLKNRLNEINLLIDDFCEKINIDNIKQQNKQIPDSFNKLLSDLSSFYESFNTLRENDDIEQLISKIENNDKQNRIRIDELQNKKEKGFLESIFSYLKPNNDVIKIKMNALELGYNQLCKTNYELKNQSTCLLETTKQIEKFQKNDKNLKEQIENLSQSLKNIQSKNQQLKNENKNLLEQIEGYKMQMYKYSNYSTNIEDLLSKNTQLENEIALLKNKIQNLQNDDKVINQKFNDQMKNVQNENSRLSNENEILIQENKTLKNDNDNENKQIISLDKTNQQLTSKNKILEEQNNDQTNEINYLRNEIKLMRDENSQLKSNVEELKKNTIKYKKQINFQNEIIQKQMYLAKVETEKQINQIRKFQNDEINAIMEVFELSS